MLAVSTEKVNDPRETSVVTGAGCLIGGFAHVFVLME